MTYQQRTLKAMEYLKEDLLQLDQIVRRSPKAHGLIHDALVNLSWCRQAVEQQGRQPWRAG